MQVRADQLSQHLTRGLAPLYVVHGEEALLAVEAGDAIRQAARAAGFAEREVLTVESGFDWSQLAMAGASMSLFADKKLLELRIPTGKPGTAGAQALQQYVTRLHADTLTLILLPALDKAGQQTKWFEALAAAGTAVLAAPITREELPRWLTARLARNQQQADGPTLDFLAARVEGNLLAAHQEVQKLALLHPAGPLSFEQVKAAVLDVARYDIYDLSAALLSGDAARYSRVLDGLAGEGEAPVLVLWQLTEDVRACLRARRALDARQPVDRALRDARVWGPRATWVERAARRLPRPPLYSALAACARIDRINKGLEAGDAWGEIRHFGTGLIQVFRANRPG